MIGKKSTKEDFVLKAIIVHGQKYNYSLVEYINYHTKVKILCPIHGDFEKSPANHLKGQGCRKCVNNDLHKKYVKDVDVFIEQANAIHHSKYDYSEIIYINAHTNIKIFCKACNLYFEQLPMHHLKGSGCKICGIITYSRSQSLSLPDFISRAEIIHKLKYNYLLVYYINGSTHIDIICPMHGVFQQTPDNHLSGRGCKKCGNAIFRKQNMWLDDLNISEEYRDLCFKINNKWFKPDAYNITTNTIYEFYGDFWHGNPLVYNQNDLNCMNKRSFGDLHKETIAREELLKNAGFNLITIWESDFDKGK